MSMIKKNWDKFAFIHPELKNIGLILYIPAVAEELSMFLY